MESGTGAVHKETEAGRTLGNLTRGSSKRDTPFLLSLIHAQRLIDLLQAQRGRLDRHFAQEFAEHFHVCCGGQFGDG